MAEHIPAALVAQGGDDWPWLRDLLTEMSSVASGITPNVPSAQRVLAAVPEEYRVAAGLPYAGCRYFVLDPLHDPIARSVLATYGALARAEGYDALADDLRDWLRSLPEPGERRG